MLVGYVTAGRAPRSLVSALLLCAAVAPGCGPRAETVAPSSHTEFVDLVDTMVDCVRQPSKFKACWADGAEPPLPERKKYEQHILVTSPDATVEGDTARFNVSFQDQRGKEVTSKEWTAVKINDKWKLKSAPLP